MSEKHLAAGSQEPRRVDGLLRLYSMKYCPFAQRAHLVLKAKQIPHDVVYIDLFSKPEWYFKINPKGLVPTIYDGSTIVTESLDIVNYLDEKYPNNPLFPAEPEAKNQDKELIEKIGAVLSVYSRCVFSNEEKTLEEWAKEFLNVLQVFEDTLAKRGTKFFRGNKPGMVDYMLWPWAERAEAITLKYGEKLPVKDDDIPLLRKWRKDMYQDSAAAALKLNNKKFFELVKNKLAGEKPNYDD